MVKQATDESRMSSKGALDVDASFFRGLWCGGGLVLRSEMGLCPVVNANKRVWALHMSSVFSFGFRYFLCFSLLVIIPIFFTQHALCLLRLSFLLVLSMSIDILARVCMGGNKEYTLYSVSPTFLSKSVRPSHAQSPIFLVYQSFSFSILL